MAAYKSGHMGASSQSFYRDVGDNICLLSLSLSLSLSEGSLVVSWSYYYLNLTDSVTGATVLRGLATW